MELAVVAAAGIQQAQVLYRGLLRQQARLRAPA